MAESVLERISLEDGYSSEEKGKVLSLKARYYGDRCLVTRPNYREARWKVSPTRDVRAPGNFRREVLKSRRQFTVDTRRQSIPHGVIAAAQEMIELLELPPGWNSYNAKPIRKENVNFALSLLGQIMRHDTPVPSVVPLVRGGVQFEWHTRGISLELSIYSPTEVILVAEDVSRRHPAVEGKSDIVSLRRWIERLSR